MMKKLLPILALVGLVLPAAQAQSPWVAPANGPVYEYSASTITQCFYSPQPNVLWGLVTEGVQTGPGSRAYQNRIYSTSDNGQTWREAPKTQFSTTVSPSISDVDLTAVDGQNAWVLRSVKQGVTAELGLFRTTTGPTGFTKMATTLPDEFNAIHFFTATTGIAVAAVASGTPNWRIYRTTDGGLTWALAPNQPPTSSQASIQRVYRKQSLGGTLWLSTDAQQLLRTTDMGLTWTAAAGTGGAVFENELRGLSFTYTTAGNVSTLHVMRTNDGGVTWTETPYVGRPFPANAKSWTAVPGRPGTYLAYSFTYPSASNLANGTITVSYDWGATWQVLESNLISGVMEQFVARYPGQLWAAVQGEYGGPNRPMVLQYASGPLLPTTRSTPSALSLAAYPNPTTGLVRLQGPLQGTETVQMYDAAGRWCSTGTVSPAQPTLNLSAQPAGLYQLRVVSATGAVRHLRVSKTQ